MSYCRYCTGSSRSVHRCETCKDFCCDQCLLVKEHRSDNASDDEEEPERIRQCRRCALLDLQLFCLICGSESYQRLMIRCQNRSCRHAIHLFCLPPDQCCTFWLCPLCQTDGFTFKVKPLPASSFFHPASEENAVQQVFETREGNNVVRLQRLQTHDFLALPSHGQDSSSSSDVFDTTTAVPTTLKEYLAVSGYRRHNGPVPNAIKRESVEPNVPWVQLVDAFEHARLRDRELVAEAKAFESDLVPMYRENMQRRKLPKDCAPALRQMLAESAVADNASRSNGGEGSAPVSRDSSPTSQTVEIKPQDESGCDTRVESLSLRDIPYALRTTLEATRWGVMFESLWPIVNGVYLSCIQHPYVSTNSVDVAALLTKPSQTLTTGSRWAKLYRKAARRVSIENLPFVFKELLYLLDRLAELVEDKHIRSLGSITSWRDLLDLDAKFCLWPAHTRTESLAMLSSGLFHMRRMLHQLEAVLHYRQYVYTPVSLYDRCLKPGADNPGNAVVDCLTDISSVLSLKLHCAFGLFGLHPPLELCESAKAGVFVKAACLIPNRTIISEYCGKVEPQRLNLTKLSNHSNSIFDLWNTGISDTSLCINPEPYTNMGRFFSHGRSYKTVNVRTCTLNVDQKVRIFFMSKRKINAGEPLFINYNAGTSNDYPTDDFCDEIQDTLGS